MKSRPFPIDKSAPRYNIRKNRGHGTLVGVAWSEPWARRLAARLAEQHGEPVVLIDVWKHKRILGYQPSKAAVERAKRIAEAPKRVTASGQDGAQFDSFFTFRRRPKEPAPLSDRVEIPEALPRRPTFPG
jgi:hypothetical protein